MTNEIVVTFKGKTGQDPWIVVHSDPGTINQALESVTADLIARVHATQEHFNAGPALAQLAPIPQSGGQVAPAEPQAATWNPAPEQSAPPVQQAPVQSAPPAQDDIPGVSIWVGPGPKINPSTGQGYPVTFYQIPFIADAQQRDALNKALKDGAWAKIHDQTTKPWTWIAPKGGTEQFVRSTIASYAHAFQG